MVTVFIRDEKQARMAIFLEAEVYSDHIKDRETGIEYYGPVDKVMFGDVIFAEIVNKTLVPFALPTSTADYRYSERYETERALKLAQLRLQKLNLQKMLEKAQAGDINAIEHHIREKFEEEMLPLFKVNFAGIGNKSPPVSAPVLMINPANSKQLSIKAFGDSGAESTVISPKIAKKLRLDASQKARMTPVANETITVDAAPLVVELTGRKTPTTVLIFEDLFQRTGFDVLVGRDVADFNMTGKGGKN